MIPGSRRGPVATGTRQLATDGGDYAWPMCRQTRRRIVLFTLFTVLAGGFSISGPPATVASVKGAAKRLQAVKRDPAKLRAFLLRMPKGADLHMHLSGSVYAESMVRWGAADGKCVDPDTLVSSYPPCTGSRVPLTAALTDGRLYDRILAAWSMRGFTPGPQSGHDHFFATFDLFGGAFGGRQGDGLAQVTRRAARQKVQYVEPLTTPQFGATAAVAAAVGYNPDLGTMRQAMLDHGLLNALPAASQQATDVISRQRAVLGCDGPDPQPACDVLVNLDVQVLRNQRPEVVFAQLLFGFELMKADPSWAGMNMVQPEDGSYSLRDYRLHMRMIRYLRGLYPDGKVTLHAGELAPGLAPPHQLRFHVREAVSVAGADRIGHGTDLRWERNPAQTLRRMKRRGTCVEIGLTSNRQILGVAGKRHPVRDYYRAGVPVTLATDDEGVSRTDLTAQYVQAVRDHGFGYRAIRKFARNGLKCAFLPRAVKRRALRQQSVMLDRFESRFDRG